MQRAVPAPRITQTAHREVDHHVNELQLWNLHGQEDHGDQSLRHGWWLWWLWWLWYGRCAARECLSIQVRACNLLKWVSASAPTSSAGLTSREKNPTPFPSEDRFQASLSARPPSNSKSRKKIARHAIFSIALELSAPGPECQLVKH